MTDKNGQSHVVIFRLKNEECAIEISSVREIIKFTKITSLPKPSPLIEGVINIRGHVIAVIDLGNCFSLQKTKRTEKNQIIIVRARRMILGLIVDAVREVSRFPKSMVRPPPAILSTQIDHRYISGVIQCSDRMIMLLNLEEVFTPSEVKSLRDSQTIALSTAPNQPAAET